MSASQFSRRLFIVVRTDGICVNLTWRNPKLELGLAGLSLLAAMDESQEGSTGDEIRAHVRAVERRFAPPPEILDTMLDALRRHDLLGEEATPSTPYVELDAAPVDVGIPDRLPPQEGWFQLNCPFVLRLRQGRYEFVGHDGRVRLELSPVEVFALKALATPTTGAMALDSHRADAGEHAVGDEAFEGLLARLAEANVLSSLAAPEPGKPEQTPRERQDALERHFVPHALAQDAEEREYEAETGRQRVRVIPVASGNRMPLGLGLIVGYAKQYEQGKLSEHYMFRTDWTWAPDRFDVFTQQPAIYLFSNYLWSHQRNCIISDRIKLASPSSITIHGGPDTPGYKGDVKWHFANNPHVDIAVHGEGEQTLVEILDRLKDAFSPGEPVDLSILSDIPGLSYRDGDSVVTTGPRPRLKDLDTIPSPYLTGLFDAFIGFENLRVTMETNRGCPYGCTFCDWGAATMTRIRKFDLDRVFREIEWLANAGVAHVHVSDANFGVFPRDVEIIDEVARLRRETGSPRVFAATYAKNSTKYLKHIVQTLTKAGLLAQGVLSFQTNDTSTLAAVKRSNIKKEKYDQLAYEMRAAGLPLIVELMLGLPGSTVASFENDLQHCMDREITARIHSTLVLINSPMNEPAYRREHGIIMRGRKRPGSARMIVSTNTYTEEDNRFMMKLRNFFMLCDHFGCLRLVSRFVRQESGLREIDFIKRIFVNVPGMPEYPLLREFAETGSLLMAPPVSWRLLFAELRAYLIDRLGMRGDAALDTALEAQVSLLPSSDRVLPERRMLQHDVVAWHGGMMRAKDEHPDEDWARIAPRLSSYGPCEFVVDDPSGEIVRSMGVPVLGGAVALANWEYATPLARRIVAEDSTDSGGELAKRLF